MAHTSSQEHLVSTWRQSTSVPKTYCYSQSSLCHISGYLAGQTLLYYNPGGDLQDHAKQCNIQGQNREQCDHEWQILGNTEYFGPCQPYWWRPSEGEGTKYSFTLPVPGGIFHLACTWQTQGISVPSLHRTVPNLVHKKLCLIYWVHLNKISCQPFFSYFENFVDLWPFLSP